MPDDDDAFILPKHDSHTEPEGVPPPARAVGQQGPKPLDVTKFAPPGGGDEPLKIGGGPQEHESIPLAPPDPPKPSKFPSMAPRKADLGATKLMDDMDDDADLTRDPDVERALRGGDPSDDTVTGEEIKLPQDPVVKEGRGEPKTVAIIGAAVLVAAVIVSVVNAESRQFAAGVSTGYLTLFHTLTGVGAVATLAYAENRPTGRIELAAARMFVAVAAFMLVLGLRFAALRNFNGWVIAPAAAVLYYAIVWVLFRLPRRQMQILAGAHAGIAILLYLLLAVHTWASNPAAGMAPPTQ
ncbi:MAG: hypothetical protein WC718_08330 [Phycisphaerales bacterium]|jgi:hypothetical protein